MKRKLPYRCLAAIPAFQESSVPKIAQALLNEVDYVLVIDDGSEEPIHVKSPLRFCRHNTNRGYGDAVNTAINYARLEKFDALILVDGDGQHDINYVSKLLTILDKYDVAVGNRLHHTSAQIGSPQPVERLEANDFMRAALQRIHPEFHLHDFFSGFLAFRLKALPHYLDLRGSRYASPARMWPCLAGAGLSISEIAIPCIYFDSGNNFLRQYKSMEALGHHIIEEFTESSVRYLGMSRESVLDILQEELSMGFYESIRSWIEPACIRDRK